MNINKLRSGYFWPLALFFLHTSILSTLRWQAGLEVCLMDPLAAGGDFNLDQGVNFPEGPNLTSTPSNASRRLSAAGRAAKLKERNLIPPLNSPTDRRVSLPRATKAATPPAYPGRKTSESSAMPAAKPTADASASVLDDIKSMIKGVRTDIASSEDRMAKKFDELSTIFLYIYFKNCTLK